MPEYRKKLIEVALPLEAINKESAHEKARRRGLPSALHLWWSRKPLATARAVLFAQLVDDPSSCPDEFPTPEMQEAERQRLFRIIEELVKWENSNNENMLHAIRTEIARSVARTQGVQLPHRMTPGEVVTALSRYAPPVADPFAGGGSIPLEAQRLGLEAHASDLNPVAVLINKALIEIPPKFANCSPVNPEASRALLHREWRGAQGLAEDIRYYGKWMCNEARICIGHLYPKVTLPKKYGGGEATIIAWIWARTVRCPNPACGVKMPLTSKWTLSTKRGKEAWIEPIIDHVTKTVHFEIQQGLGSPEGTVNRQGVRCLVCSSPVSFDYVRAEGQAGRMGMQLMAIAAEGKEGRVYLPPSEEQEALAVHAKPQWEPETSLPKQALGFRVQPYGMTMHRDLFTPRQLVTLTTLSDLIGKVRERALADACLAHMPDDGVPLSEDGTGAQAYADALATYLGMVVSKMSNRANALSPWMPEVQCPGHLFSRQAISMSWDFAEGNSLDGPSGSWESMLDDLIAGILSFSACHIQTAGVSTQLDATSAIEGVLHPLISTDPPYYDNISYADLSDFFYVWLRRSIRAIYPDLFSTFLVPKVQELVATPFRFDGDKKKAQDFFEDGLGKAFSRMRAVQHLEYPLTLYYAFKQAESDEDGDENSSGSMTSASTGWETMLEGLIKAGFAITGTWPMRTERSARTRSLGSNALASSIVLVCRPRPAGAVLTTRRDFLNALKRELPKALRDLQRGNIAPVDLAQAAIGPGMAVFSRYSKVLESDGTPMRVRTALQLINQMLDEVLAEQEGEYDADTRWAIAWFEQYGMEKGPYGVAETLSKAKNTAVGALVEAGILEARGGKVWLIRRGELSSDWNAAVVKRLTAWEVTQRLIRALQEQGEVGTAAILEHVGTYGEVARDLAYRLYTICERKKWADEALAYNSLIVEWSDISGVVEQMRRTTAEQAPLFS